MECPGETILNGILNEPNLKWGIGAIHLTEDVEGDDEEWRSLHFYKEQKTGINDITNPI